MLLAGEAHIADLPRELQGDAISAGMEIVSFGSPNVQLTVILNGLYLQGGDPAARPDLPWADVRIREAMNRAVNREELIEILYDGRAEKLVRFGMDPRHEGFVPELIERFEEDYGYDPDRSRRLLDEAGYPAAFPDPVIPIISLVLPGNPEFGTMAELLQIYFENIGLQTELREMDLSSLAALGRARSSYAIHPSRESPIRPTEVHLINSYTPGGSPYRGFEDDHIQRLIDQLRATIDPDQRNRIAEEAFIYLYEQYSDIPIAVLRDQMTVNLVSIPPRFIQFCGWPFWWCW